ncbi:unnamed protein product, partial [Mesorhabditis belari]|uniref:CHK kinase-like domain-containing protein n=1 Tax=Mesorhabditis belari TaxID=2138241 RepID=A0AAF3FHK2_9BILA
MARIGDKRTVQVIGRGMGYVSKLLLIHFDWTSVETFTRHLPECAVVKITIDPPELKPPTTPPSPNDPMILFEQMMHDTELFFYENSIDPTKIPADLKIPKFYCGRKYGVEEVDAGYIALEYIRNTVDRHFYHNIPRNGVIDALDELVKLAVFSVKSPDSLKIWPKSCHSLMSNVLAYCKFYDPNLEERLRRVMERFPELVPELATIIEYLPRNFLDFQNFLRLQRSTCTKPMLCQGDIWSPNILWIRDENDDYRVGGIIDWQIAQIGSPLEDLVFLFHSCLSADEYEKNTNNYLEYYFEQLQKSTKFHELPWGNLDELIKSYEIAYAYMIPVLLPLTVLLVDFEKTCSENVIEQCIDTWRTKRAPTGQQVTPPISSIAFIVSDGQGTPGIKAENDVRL